MSWASILSCLRLIYELAKAVWRLIKPFHKEWAKEHREAGIAWIDWFWAKAFAFPNIFCLVWPAQVSAARVQSTTFNDTEVERNSLLPEGISTENCYFMERAAPTKCQDPRKTSRLEDAQENLSITIHHGTKRRVIARRWIPPTSLNLIHVRPRGGFAYEAEERSPSMGKFCTLLWLHATLKKIALLTEWLTWPGRKRVNAEDETRNG